MFWECFLLFQSLYT